jgi:hypothetical protein
MAEIKDPAVVFSKEGWKAFLGFMSELIPSTVNRLEDPSEIAALIAGYEERHSEPKNDHWREKAQPEIDAVVSILKKNRVPMKLKEIALEMNDIHRDSSLEWGMNASTWSTRMEKVRKYEPRIQKVGYGLYDLMIDPEERFKELEEAESR